MDFFRHDVRRSFRSSLFFLRARPAFFARERAVLRRAHAHLVRHERKEKKKTRTSEAGGVFSLEPAMPFSVFDFGVVIPRLLIFFFFSLDSRESEGEGSLSPPLSALSPRRPHQRLPLARPTRSESRLKSFRERAKQERGREREKQRKVFLSRWHRRRRPSRRSASCSPACGSSSSPLRSSPQTGRARCSSTPAATWRKR